MAFALPDAPVSEGEETSDGKCWEEGLATPLTESFTSGRQTSWTRLATVSDDIVLAEHDIPTVGARAHQAGTCRPCFYVHSRNGCHYGDACIYCHEDHEVPKKCIPGKAKRIKYRGFVERLFAQYMRAGTPYPAADAAIQEHPDFPVHDRVAASYTLKLLRNQYKSAGHETAPRGTGVIAMRL